MKKLLFLDVSQGKTIVDLPTDFGGQLEGAEIVHWDIQGFPTIVNNDGEVSSPHYCQIRFSDGLISEVLSNSSHPDYIPVPLLRFGGWPPSGNQWPIPISIRRTLSRRFIFEIFDEGETPSYLSFNRALFWINLKIKPTRGAGGGTSTRPRI